MRLSRVSSPSARAVAALVLTLSAFTFIPAARGAEKAPPAQAAFGEVFPAGVYTNLGAAGAADAKVDLKGTIGKKPVVFCYWIPEHERSEEALQAAQQIADQAGTSKLAVYGVVTQPVGANASVVADWLKSVKERIAALKIHVPVLEDDGFKVGRLLAVRSVPSIAVLDAEGRLRMANAASMKQALEYKMDVGDALRRLASTGVLGTYGALPPYFPAVELVGKKCPDFEAPLLGDGTMRKASSLLAPNKVNVLIFWSEDCPHCRKSLPQINAYLKAHPDGINVISAAKVLTDAARLQTEAFCKQEGFIFPTVADSELKMGQMFMVTSTPTVFIIRPDGVIDSVLFSGEADYGATFDAKKKELLKS